MSRGEALLSLRVWILNHTLRVAEGGEECLNPVTEEGQKWRAGCEPFAPSGRHPVFGYTGASGGGGDADEGVLIAAIFSPAGG